MWKMLKGGKIPRLRDPWILLILAISDEIYKKKKWHNSECMALEVLSQKDVYENAPSPENNAV